MNRNPDVDRWFEQAGHPLEATMRRARDIILGADGRVTESIKWKTPTFAYRGNIASFNPSKHLLSILFHRGAEIPGEHPRLEDDLVDAALSRFRPGAVRRRRALQRCSGFSKWKRPASHSERSSDRGRGVVSG